MKKGNTSLSDKKLYLLLLGIGLFSLFFVFAPATADAVCNLGTDDDGVWLYPDEDCEGDAWPILDYTTEIWDADDVVWSLKIAGDHTVFFYENINFEKRFICFEGPRVIEDFNSYLIRHDNGWEDDVSSIKIDPEDQVCLNPGVTIEPPINDSNYEFINFSLWDLTAPDSEQPCQGELELKILGTEEAAKVDGAYLWDRDGGDQAWRSTTKDIKELSKEVPRDNISCTDGDVIGEQTGFLEIVGDYDVRIWEGEGYIGRDVCFRGPTGGMIELDTIPIEKTNGWNGDTDSIQVGKSFCTNPGETMGESYDEERGWGILGGLSQFAFAIINLGTLIKFGLPVAAITIVIYLLAAITAVLASALSVLIGLIMSAILDISVLPGGTNTLDMVTVGWTLSRDLVNLLFILILVFIGLATILRIKDYELQTTLPKLIIIALLVNFSGVLVAFIVDMANLVTNFFVSQITGFDLAFVALKNMSEAMMGQIANVLLNITTDPVSYIATLLTPAATSLAIALFFIALVLVLFMILLIFVVRVAILWMLTILAPIAFAAYILPATKKYWTKWWEQLLQWSIVGIPITFFLYLTWAMVLHIGDVTDKFSWGGSADNALADALANIIAPATALIFLYVGITLSLQMAPAGARGIVNSVKKVGGKAALVGGMALGTKMGRWASPGIEKAGRDIRNWGQRVGTAPEGAGRLRRGVSAFAGFGINQAGRSTEFLGTTVRSAIENRDKDEIKAGKDAVKDKSPGAQTRILRNALTMRDKNRALGALEGMNPDDVDKAITAGNISLKDIQGLYGVAKQQGRPTQRTFIKRFLHRKDDLGIEDGDYEDALEDLKAADFDGISSEAVNPTTEGGKMALNGIREHLDPQLIAGFLRRKKSERKKIWEYWKKSVTEKIKESGKSSIQWLFDNDQDGLQRWSLGQGAENIGIGPFIEEITADDIKKWRAGGGQTPGGGPAPGSVPRGRRPRGGGPTGGARASTLHRRPKTSGRKGEFKWSTKVETIQQRRERENNETKAIADDFLEGLKYIKDGPVLNGYRFQEIKRSHLDTDKSQKHLSISERVRAAGEAERNIIQSGTAISELSSTIEDGWKVHLQPKHTEEDMKEVMKALTNLIERSENLQTRITEIKFRAPSAMDRKDKKGGILPGIVIYTAGKDNLESILGELTKGLKEYEDRASGEGPRHSEKVSELISYAQAGGDLKNELSDLGQLGEFFDSEHNHALIHGEDPPNIPQ